MANIYKRGKNWRVHYYVNVNGKSVDRSLRTSNERVARDRKNNLEAAGVVGRAIRRDILKFCARVLAT